MRLQCDIGLGCGWMHVHGGQVTETGVAFEAGSIPASLRTVVEEWWADNACDYYETALQERRRTADDRLTHAVRDGETRWRAF